MTWSFEPPSEGAPFSEPPYLIGLPSPYYTLSHHNWQKACRAFLDKHFHSHALEWESEGDVPLHVFDTFAAHNVIIANLPAPLPVEWLKKAGIDNILGSVKVEEWDYFHTAIFADEMSRCGLAGPSGAINTGLTYGLPPIINFASQALKERVLPDLLLGKTRTCIAITEPGAGSDVANISTTASMSADKSTYVVNGTKKWISNALWADYATMAVRTGVKGPSGLSLLLVPLIEGRKAGTIKMERLKTTGLISAGTTLIEMKGMQVPVENLIGEEGHGMKYIMTNFNHERLMISIGVTRQSRVALSSAFEYCMERVAFDQTLMDQPVVRNRLAQAGAELETLWAWVESFVFQMNNMKKSSADIHLGGLTGLLKAKAGMVFNEVAQCAVLLFGGNGFTENGPSEVVASK